MTPEERREVLEEAVREIECNWGHVATPELRDAIRALAPSQLAPAAEPQFMAVVHAREDAKKDMKTLRETVRMRAEERKREARQPAPLDAERVRELEDRLREITDACEADCGVPDDDDEDDEAVGAGFDADGVTIRPMALTFGILRRARAALRQKGGKA